MEPIVRNECGAVILITLMILALMTIIGISALTMSISESLSVRNAGLFKQNLHLVESAVMEGLQRIADMEFDGVISDLDPHRTAQDWIINDEEWEITMEKKWSSATSSGPVLNASNSVVPEGIKNGTATENIILSQRGELNDDSPAGAPLRYTLIGWEAADGCSLKTTTPVRRKGRLLAEYVSENYGILRLEIGLERKF
ncbi:MAG: pilus assembly PilX N-terminal domain-containing protein [Desulfobacterales bacterium]|jgi:hypothetical protein|nr:pilus assembly PilX N-terminal domain-containing protein [Desulfobacterales bacterium]